MLEVWRNTSLRPIDQPKAVGSVAVGAVTGPSRTLFVVGIDPTTGAKLWQQPLTPSRLTPGVQVDITKVGDDKVAYLRPTTEMHFAELVVADARTGRDLLRSPEGIFTSPAEVCPDGRDVCTGWAPDPSDSRNQYRLVIATGEFRPEHDGAPLNARTLHRVGLLDLGDRPGNTLGLMRDGKLLWTTPASAAFPAGFSSDHGWAWHLFADRHVLVGSLYGAPTISGEKVVHDLASIAATAGLAEATGEVLWRDRGSSFQCPLSRHGNSKYPVRCRFAGIATHQVGGGGSFEGLDVTIEGFDVTTGATTWSVPVGAAEALVGGGTRPAVAGPTHAALQGPAGPIVLDYATGRVTAPAPDATFWCMTQVEYDFAQPYPSRSGQMRHKRAGGVLATICDRRGYTATEPPSVDATAAIGASIGAHAVVATGDGYVGFQARSTAARSRSGSAPAF
jgi:hypothetical protein